MAEVELELDITHPATCYQTTLVFDLCGSFVYFKKINYKPHILIKKMKCKPNVSIMLPFHKDLSIVTAAFEQNLLFLKKSTNFERHKRIIVSLWIPITVSSFVSVNAVLFTSFFIFLS